MFGKYLKEYLDILHLLLNDILLWNLVLFNTGILGKKSLDKQNYTSYQGCVRPENLGSDNFLESYKKSRNSSWDMYTREDTTPENQVSATKWSCAMT